MSEFPDRKQALEMVDRMRNGMTTSEDADLFGQWLRRIWEMQRERMFGPPLNDVEEANWKEHEARIKGGD